MIELESQHAQQAFKNYSRVILFALGVLIISYLQGLATELVVLKLLATPVIWLALRGPDALFKYPVYEGSYTFRAFEYSMISGYVLGMVGLFLGLQPDTSILKLVSISLVLAPVLGIVLFVNGVKRSAT